MKYLKKPVFIILIVVVIISIISIIIVNNMDSNEEVPINKPLIPENSDVCEEMNKTLCYEVKGKLDDYLRDNLFKVEENTDRYEEKSIYNISNYGSILLKMNYKSVENSINNQYAFYDKKNNKIYSGYAFIDVIDTNKIYLGRYNDNKTVSIYALSIDDSKLSTIDESAPYYNDKCFSYNSSTYFMTNKLAYFYNTSCEKVDKLKLYDKNFNKLNEDFKLYSYNEKNIYLYKDSKLYIYDESFNETIVNKTNIIGLSATHAFINSESKVKLMSYEDILNNSSNYLNTGVKFNSKMSLRDIGVLKEGVIMFSVVDAKKKETKYAFDVKKKLLMKYKKAKK